MANAPEQGIMALPENEEMGRPQISLDDSYDAVRSALAEVSPRASQDVHSTLRAGVDKLPELSPEQIDSAIEVLSELYNADEAGYERVLKRLIAEGKASPGDFPDQYDPEFLATAMALLMEVKKRGNETEAPEMPEPPVGMARGGIAEAVRKVAGKGRKGDTMLAHIGPEEAAMLRRHGGAGTINPATGLPEYGFFGDLWSSIKGAVKDVLSSPVGRIVGTIALAYVMGPAALGWTSSMAAAMPFASGAATLLAGGSVKDALKSAAVSYLSGPTGPLGEAMGSVAANMGITNPALAQFAGSALTGAGATLLTGGKLKDAVRAGLMQGAMTTLMPGAPSKTAAPVETLQGTPVTPGLETLPGSTTAAPTLPSQGPGPVAGAEPAIAAPAAPAAPGAPTAPAPITPAPAAPLPGQPSMPTLEGTAPSAEPAGPGIRLGGMRAMPPVQPPSGNLDIGPSYSPEGYPVAGTGAAGSMPAPEAPYTPGALQLDYQKTLEYKTPSFTDSMGKAYDALKTGDFTQAGSELKNAFMPPSLSDAELMQRPEFQQYRTQGFTADKALEMTRQAVNPSTMRQYAPMVGAGLGVMSLAGGFKRPQPTQTPYQKYMNDKLAREQAWLTANPGAFYIQNMPGVTYDAQGRPLLGGGAAPLGFSYGGMVPGYDEGGPVENNNPPGNPPGNSPAPAPAPAPGTDTGGPPPASVPAAQIRPWVPYPQGAVVSPSVGATQAGHDAIFNQQQQYNQAIARMLGVSAPPAPQMPSVINPYGAPGSMPPAYGQPIPGAPIVQPVTPPAPAPGPAPAPAPGPAPAPAPVAPPPPRVWVDPIYPDNPINVTPPVSPPIDTQPPPWVDPYVPSDPGPPTWLDPYPPVDTQPPTWLDPDVPIDTPVEPPPPVPYDYGLGDVPYDPGVDYGFTPAPPPVPYDYGQGDVPYDPGIDYGVTPAPPPVPYDYGQGDVPYDSGLDYGQGAARDTTFDQDMYPPRVPAQVIPDTSAPAPSSAYQPAYEPPAYVPPSDTFMDYPGFSGFGAGPGPGFSFDFGGMDGGYANGGIAGLAQALMPTVPFGTGYSHGGYPPRTGQISGPGTETSDSIPAMLSDGEFVMTAKAVRAMGNGSRREGAKRMYALMHRLERNASKG